MTGLIIVIFLAAAIPLGIVVFAVVATNYEARPRVDAKELCASMGRGVAALIFGTAATLCLVAIYLAPGTKLSADYFGFALLWVAIPAIAIAALLAAILVKPLVCSRRLLAALYGGGIALLTVLASAALAAIVAVSGPRDILGVFLFGATIVLMPFGISIFLVGSVAGFLLNHISNRRRPNTPLNTDAPTSDAPVS